MNHASKLGFTLIELMLAMTFISILLVSIAMTTVQIGNIYNKGVTLREVNQAGRAISNEFQRSITSAQPFDVTPKVDDSADTAGSRYVDHQGGGRLCLGQYSYAWNYGTALAGGTGAPMIFNRYEDDQAVRFVKVSDPSAALCRELDSKIQSTEATEMLASGDRDLAMQDFDITRSSRDPLTGQVIYAISMTIGTNDQQQLTSNQASCQPPSEGVGNENFCSVNRFDLIVRAGNQAGGN